MARVKGGSKLQQRKKILKLAKGYFGSKHRIYLTANESVMRAWAYAYRDRRNVKRDFRKLWITRINAASNLNGLSYSRFMYGLKVAGIEINRKMLSEIAIHDSAAFTSLVKLAKDAIASGKKPAVKVIVPAVKKVAEVKVPEVVVAETPKGVEIKVEAPKKKAEPKVEVAEEAAKPAVKKAAPKAKKVEAVEGNAVEEKKPAVKKTVKKAEVSADAAVEEKKPAVKKAATPKAKKVEEK